MTTIDRPPAKTPYHGERIPSDAELLEIARRWDGMDYRHDPESPFRPSTDSAILADAFVRLVRRNGGKVPFAGVRVTLEDMG